MFEVANDVAGSPQLLPNLPDSEWGYGITVAELFLTRARSLSSVF